MESLAEDSPALAGCIQEWAETVDTSVIEKDAGTRRELETLTLVTLRDFSHLAGYAIDEQGRPAGHGAYGIYWGDIGFGDSGQKFARCDGDNSNSTNLELAEQGLSLEDICSHEPADPGTIRTYEDRLKSYLEMQLGQPENSCG